MPLTKKFIHEQFSKFETDKDVLVNTVLASNMEVLQLIKIAIGNDFDECCEPKIKLVGWMYGADVACICNPSDFIIFFGEDGSYIKVNLLKDD